MTNEEIRELIHIARETGVMELEVQRGDSRVRITLSRGTTPEVVVPTMVPVALSTTAATTIAAAQQQQVEAASTAPIGAISPSLPDEAQHDVSVKSPIVGTYYDSPSPGSASFVKVGDRVEPKQVLCIIESMKLMNEIEAEVGGTLISKLVENGRPVEYGETLFTIRPFSA